MRFNKKIIILIVLLIILILICYVFISGYLHDLEENTFYETMKNVSDIENKSDTENYNTSIQSSVTTAQMQEYGDRSIDAINKEVEILEDLKNKVSNESYKQYIDIELNRLHNENRTYTIILEYVDLYNKYKNGEMGYSQALSLIKDKQEELGSYSNATTQCKIESDTFLNQHKDMKERFNQLGIDEDFLYNEVQEVNINYIY